MAKAQSGVKEAAIERTLRRCVEALGGACIKVRAIGTRGFPDRLIALPGRRIMLVELKRPRGGRLSPHQRQCHATFDALGVEIAIVRTIEDIERLLSPH